MKLGSFSTLGPCVDCYNQGFIEIGNHTVISQKSYLCASSHDYQKKDFPLILKPIKIGSQVWVAADAFVGPGVIIEDQVIVAARSAVFNNIEANTVVRGNPAQVLKRLKK